MIIMLEGVDGSGKSVLAKRLNNLLKKYETVESAQSMIPTRPGVDIDRLDKDNLELQLRKMANDPVIYICDRGPISDVIYRKYDDYEPIMQEDAVTSLLHELSDRMVLIHVRSEHARNRIYTRGEDNPVALKHHARLSDDYREFMRKVEHIEFWSVENGQHMTRLTYDFAKRLMDKVTDSGITLKGDE